MHVICRHAILINETRKDVSFELVAPSTGLELNIRNVDLDTEKEDNVTNEIKSEEIPKKDIRDNIG